MERSARLSRLALSHRPEAASPKDSPRTSPSRLKDRPHLRATHLTLATHTRAAATVAGRSRSRGERKTLMASFPVVVVAAAARVSPRSLPLTRDPPKRGSSQRYSRPTVFKTHIPKDKYLTKKTYLPKQFVTSPQPSPCPQVTPLVHIPLPLPDVPVGGRLTVRRPLGEGLQRFSRSRGRKVRRVAVLPGQTNTPSTSGVLEEATKAASRVAEARRQHAVERCCGTSPPTIAGLPQQHVSGPQEERRDETDHQFEGPQHISGEGEVQDGDPASQGRVGHVHQSQGRLLPCPDQGSSQEVPALHSQGDGLPVSGSPLWPYHSAEGVYQGHGDPGLNSSQERDQPSPLPERLASQGQILSEVSDPDEGGVAGYHSVGLYSQSGQVRTDPDAAVLLSRRGLRSSPGHCSPDSGEGRQDPYSLPHSPEASLPGSLLPSEGAGSSQRGSRCHPTGQTPHETTSTLPPQPVVHVHTTFVLQGVSEQLLSGPSTLVEQSTEIAARTTSSVTKGD